ncbi:MAG: glycolate oxidase subunit GlcF [Burkholderiaceae bacterium]|nr:glycolate oxidase subunit GlcF [Burkholderiaceae bacterium]
METHLASWLEGTPDGAQAEKILRSCVHCGFCTATCPTYQLLGDERDGPRGRIYLIKQVVEGATPTAATMTHLDRCLTCRSCETTCPSGVQYARLVDIGRKLVDERVRRPLAERLVRFVLREGMTRRWLFGPAMRAGQIMRALLPGSIRDKVPPRKDPGAWPVRQHPRRVLLLNACVQPAMMPRIDAATARVLDAIGVQSVIESRSGCCGAIRQHLGDPSGALADARRNIDAWWAHLDGREGVAGVEAILINASGCGAMVKEYAHLLRDDPAYADRAARVVALTKDLAQWLPAQFADACERTPGIVRYTPHGAVAFHAPCTLQHGQQVRGEVERFLESLGVAVQPVAEAHLCCGSAGTYSVTQPELSRQLRERKLANLQAASPRLVLSANIGCIAHLQASTDTPVMHWIEWLDRAIATDSAPEAAGSPLG